MTGILVLSYLHSIIDFSLQIPGFLIVFWILIGCWVARSLAEEPVVRRTSPRKFAAVKPAAEVQEPIGAGVA
jgi:hypothetical protein